MATVQHTIAGRPSAVFAVLSDGWLYSGWVVGTSHIQALEDTWPAPGSRLHHASGAWPLTIRDVTTVDSVTPDHELVLTVRGRPIGEARVTIELTPADDGASTLVTMHEIPVAGLGKRIHNPATDALLARRNQESLARLAALVERPTQPAR
jgi:hypothetical protein